MPGVILRYIGRVLAWLLINVFGNLFDDGPFSSRVLAYIEPRLGRVLTWCGAGVTGLLTARALRWVGGLLAKLAVLCCIAGPIVLGTPGKTGPWGSIIFAVMVVLTIFSTQKLGGFTYPRVLALALAIDVTIPVAIVVQSIVPAFDIAYFLWFSLGLTAGIAADSLLVSRRGVARSIWVGVRKVLPGIVVATGLSTVWLVAFGGSIKSLLLAMSSVSTIVMVGLFFWAGATVGHRLIRPGLLELGRVRPYLGVMQWPVVGFAVGYLLIVLWFAGLFSSVYHAHPANSFAVAGNATQHATWGTFLYFSFMTISTLGYGDIHPSSALTQALTSIEVFVGIGWTVVVFAAVVAYVTPRFAAMATAAPRDDQ